ncbi:MAG: 16S rRNA (guanine(966)-N(2))-methyltransferase RsmD [Saprospirales bacterium]|nr:MAG: 16S rRNA (guanine(966)-N(2))-methyltransferase RsmD [Saprospirales bacterium]
MRVISGKYRGRKFNPPVSGWPTRPTTDFARESLFNLLQNRIDFNDIEALDLFAGSGGHSLELISRGAQSVIAVDKHRACCSFIQKTAEEWGIHEEIKVVNADVAAYIKKAKKSFDYIFADPPFSLPWIKKLPTLIFDNSLLKDGGLLVIEHPTHLDLNVHPNFSETRKYSKLSFSFFEEN